MNYISTLSPSLVQSFGFRLRISLKTFWILSVVLILALLVFYILQVNFLIKEIYLIQDYEKKLKQLSMENENLEIQFSQLNSLKNLQDLVKNFNYEKIDRIHYIQVLEGSMVTK